MLRKIKHKRFNIHKYYLALIIKAFSVLFKIIRKIIIKLYSVILTCFLEKVVGPTVEGYR